MTLTLVAVDELVDPATPLDPEVVEALLASSHDGRIRQPARAWAEAYGLARWLGFAESTALLQAGAAWDRVATMISVEACDAER